MTRLHLATASTPGAIALLQLHGQDTLRILQQLTGRADWLPGRVALCHFADIDEGLAVILQSSGDAASTPWAQLMPHGGPRVVQRLIEHLVTLGCSFEPAPDPRDIYPEAASAIEADLLHAIAHAPSPAAIDLLAGQPELWRALLQSAGALSKTCRREAIATRSHALDQLVTPPTVVVVGRANVGKSTLTNALSGRAVSIVADLPGTTRDWVGSLVELDAGLGLVAVHWLDTPGLRVSDDSVEQRAIVLARSVTERADVLVAMCDAEHNWPEAEALPRMPDVWVMNKCDGEDEHDAPGGSDSGRSPDHPLRISADLGHGLRALQHHVLSQLGLGSLDPDTPWAFSPTLRRWAAGEPVDLDTYLNP